MYIIDKKDRVCQGDLYENLIFLEFLADTSELDFKTLPYAIVLSQECDLKWDYEGHDPVKIKHNQFLNSILCCPAYKSHGLREGTHLGDKKYIMREFVKNGKPDNTSWKQVKQNSDPRYHFLRTFKIDDITIPELVIDFKHYYSIPRDLFYHTKNKANYKSTLNIPFREMVSQRFAYFVSRIGEPDLTIETEEVDCNLDPCHSE